jgi:predicted ATPase
MVLRGWALAMQGQGEQGTGEIRQGLDADLAAGSKVWQPYFLGLLAEAYGADGRPEEGLEELAVMDATEVRFYEAELHRLKGTLLLKQAVPDTSQAESCFQHAMTVAQQQSAKSWELRAATSLACLWQSQGKHQDAYELLAPVYGWFTEGFDTADLHEAKTLLEHCPEITIVWSFDLRSLYPLNVLKSSALRGSISALRGSIEDLLVPACIRIVV